MRAARQIPGAGASNRWVAWGHSQGGHAALWTAARAASLVPKLRLRGVVAAVAAVDVLDDFLAPVGLDVEVDVGRAITLRREEPLEEQTERHRIGLGDAERVTDGAVGRAGLAAHGPEP